MQIVSTCLARNLTVYRVTLKRLRKHLPVSKIYVIIEKDDFRNSDRRMQSMAVVDSAHLYDDFDSVKQVIAQWLDSFAPQTDTDSYVISGRYYQ